MFYGLSVHKENLNYLKKILIEKGGIKRVISNQNITEEVRKLYEKRINSKNFIALPPFQKLSKKDLLKAMDEVKQTSSKIIEEEEKVF